MKINSYSSLWAKFAIASVTVFSASFPAFAYEWQASIIPASLNADKTIRLAGGEIQPLILALQADKEVTASPAEHDIVLEWDFPAGMNIVSSAGRFTFAPEKSRLQAGRNITSFQVQVANKDISGAPGARLRSEGQNRSIFVTVPQTVPAGQDYIQLNLQDGKYRKTFKWPLKLITLTPPAQLPKRTSLGFWDYNYSRATSEVAAKGIAKLFKDSGITFTQSATNSTYRSALQAQGITTGGYTHHSVFYNKQYSDYSVSGKPLAGSFADPQAILNLPKNAVIPGVAQLIANAKAGDGIADFDYEPKGTNGFSPLAIAAFKKQYQINDADFKTFQSYVAKNGLKTHQSTNPLITKIWQEWTEFRTAQATGYMRRIYQAVKSQAPEVRLALTSSRSYGKDSLRTLALGADNAAMASFTDIIMPQIYSGYGAANAKLVMQMTAGWKAEIQQQQAKTQLWPLLLVRYSGANTGNSPQRLRQQIIGALANGANGIGFYYPGNMDGPYWEMLARTSEDIAKYEDFYQDGQRVDQQFTLSGLPKGCTQVAMYPNYEETVQNPGWSFTAHQLKNKVLLTLINLKEANDLVFGINIGKAKVLSTQNAEQSGENQWLVGPGQIAFLVLEQE